MRDSDTIFALATPPGRSALAIFRISGTLAAVAVCRLTGRPLPSARRASVRYLVDSCGAPIDQAVVTYFAAPNSFTGEDLLELSVHGGRSVVASVTSALGAMPGLRSAEPGEFTRRAFRNGRIDLTQAEAIADLIDSETEFQRRQALRVLGGALGDRLRSWRADLIGLCARFEAFLDFSDEADVAEPDRLALLKSCALLIASMQSELASSSRTLALRNGFSVVIAGPPNAGKSSLFNHLCGDEAAIVTSVPGTTRDVIARTIDLDGAPVTLMDTAGLRVAQDEVESIGIARAERAAQAADLVLWLVPPGCVDLPIPGFGTPILRVFSKADLDIRSVDELAVSVYDPESLQKLRQALRERAIDTVGEGSEGGLIRERHKSGLLQATCAVEAMRSNIENQMIELAAEDGRTALHALGQLVGDATPDEILGEIFARFCIGK